MKTLMSAMVLGTLSISSAIAGNTGGKVIYGEDNRTDIVELGVGYYSDLASATAGRVYKGLFKLTEDRKITVAMEMTLASPEGANACSDERFADQPTVADCSGFLIADDLLVTAGHCATAMGTEVKNTVTADCKQNAWLFDYKTDANGVVNLKNISRENLFECKEVVYAKYQPSVEENGKIAPGDDFAIIRLTKKVVGRVPLKIRTQGKVNLNDDIFVIGYPSGLPAKFAGDAKVLENTFKRFFSTNLDTFGGNSGSAVFNAKTGEVEGILVRGKTDYIDVVLPNGSSCRRVNQCDQSRGTCTENDDKIDGEQVTRITELLPHIQGLL